MDFDATDSDVSDSVIPHFRGINEALRSYDNYYKVGVCASRNPCSRLFAEGLTTTSFVLDMSNGYSGNLGFVMPKNWAFDQIATVTVGSGVNTITIDKVISSGKDLGQATVVAPPSRREQAFDFSRLEALKAGIKEYLSHIDTTIVLWPSIYGSIDRVMQYDSYITNLSWIYGIRKALIQAVTFWEDYKRTVADDAADLLVRQTYTSKEAMIAWLAGGSVGAPPALPVIETLDCSTGLAQIFAKTAIAGRNWARSAGILTGPVLDPAQWQTVWSVWQNLNSDDLYNVGSVPGVLSWGAADMAIPRPNWDSTPEQTRSILARYNGKGVDADNYGVQVFGVYGVFETFNSYSR